VLRLPLCYGIYLHKMIFFSKTVCQKIGLPLDYLPPLVFGMFTISPASCSFVFCQEDKGVLWRKERRNKLHLPVLCIFAKGKEVGLEENSSLEACWHLNTLCFSMFFHAWFCLFSSFGVGFHDYTTFHNHFMIAPQHIIP
jgi:hypothetical protein